MALVDCSALVVVVTDDEIRVCAASRLAVPLIAIPVNPSPRLPLPIISLVSVLHRTSHVGLFRFGLQAQPSSLRHGCATCSITVDILLD